MREVGQVVVVFARAAIEWRSWVLKRCTLMIFGSFTYSCSAMTSGVLGVFRGTMH